MFLPDQLDEPSCWRITTVDFDRVKQFYADTYEWLMKVVVLYVGLFNILNRGHYNAVPIVPEFPMVQDLASVGNLMAGSRRRYTTLMNLLPGYFEFMMHYP